MKIIRLLMIVSLMLAGLPASVAQAAPTAVDAPVLLAPAQGSTPDIIRPVFDWGDVAGATSYELVVSIYSNYAFPLIDVTPSASTFTPTSDLTRTQTIYWEVRVLTPVAGPWTAATFVAPNPPYSPDPLTPGLGADVMTATPTLTWQASQTPLPSGTTFAYFQLQVDQVGDFVAPMIDIQSSDVSYTFAQPLLPSTTYSWRIRAANTLNQFSMWRTSNFITSLPAPTLLSPASGAVVSSLRPLLDWNDVAGATGYGVELSFHPDMSSPFISLAVTASEYTPTLDLAPSTVIYWHVRTHGASDNSNISDWSASTFTTPAQSSGSPTPSATGPSPTPTGTSTATPTATVTATRSATPTGPTPTVTATRTNTPIGPTPTPTVTATRSITPTVTATRSITPTGPTPTTTATATRSVTPITPSPTFTRTATPTGPTPTPTITLTRTITRTPTLTATRTITPTPTITRTVTRTPTRTVTSTAAPKPVLLSPASGSTPNIIRPVFDWSDVPGATSYVLQVSIYSNYAFFVINTTLSASTFTPTDDLPRNVPIFWRVRVATPFNSGWVSSSFNAPNPPFSPAPLSPGLNALVTNYLTTLSWATSVIPSGTTFAYYRLQVASNANFTSPLLDLQLTDPASDFYTFTTALTPNSTYYWRVLTANTLGQFSMWRTSSFRTALLPPTLLSPAPGTNPSTLRVVFDWNDVPNNAGYGIEVSVHPDFSSPLVTLAVTASKYAMTADLPPNTLIYWHVRTHGTNISAWSSASFTSPNPPGPVTLLSPLGTVVGLNPTLRWGSPIMPAGTTFGSYQVQVADNANFTSLVLSVSITSIAQRSFSLPAANTLSPNTLYYWRVRAGNSLGQFSAWTSNTFTTTASPPPATATLPATLTPTRTATLAPTATRTPTPTPTVTPTP